MIKSKPLKGAEVDNFYVDFKGVFAIHDLKIHQRIAS